MYHGTVTGADINPILNNYQIIGQPTGWVCPICGRVYAPRVFYCF